MVNSGAYCYDWSYSMVLATDYVQCLTTAF